MAWLSDVERTHLKPCSSIISAGHTLLIALRVSWSIWNLAGLLYKIKCTSARFRKMSLQLFLHNSMGEATLPLMSLTRGNLGRVYSSLTRTKVSLCPCLSKMLLIFAPFICTLWSSVSSWMLAFGKLRWAWTASNSQLRKQSGEVQKPRIFYFLFFILVNQKPRIFYSDVWQNNEQAKSS